MGFLLYMFISNASVLLLWKNVIILNIYRTAVIAEVGITPYQFEPYISESDGPISENESGDEENRLADNAW